jgi:rhodanese-related sulfurtransferase
MPRPIAPKSLQFLRDQGSLHALLDVREPGEYNAAHIPGSSLLPRRQLEFRIERLVPSRGVQVVLCDDDGRRAALAARTLERADYSRVAVLDGGINAWVTAGYPTEWGMNVLSKDFGEMVEVRHHVPTIEAPELERRLQSGEEVVILDTRTPEEYQRFCIPGGRSLPGGELALRITDIARERPNATLVVNCAGRTRSIIGARVLQRMGLQVMSLKNGTAGWMLAGLELERGGSRLELPGPSAEGRAAAEAYARRLAAEDGVRPLGIEELRAWMAVEPDQQPHYLVDVRTEEEFAAGHIPGFWWFPGGQAVQRADDVVAVPGARIVFACEGIVRSTVAASWYRQMGFANVYSVEGGVEAWRAAGGDVEIGMAELPPLGLAQAEGRVPALTPAEVALLIAGDQPPRVLFVDPSDAFARGHVPGARWLPRGWLELRIAELAPDRRQAIVVTDENGPQAALAAWTLAELGYTDVSRLSGGMTAWRQAAFQLETGLAGVMQSPNDVIAMGPDRTMAEMINYLRWEEALGQKYAETPSEGT